MADIQGKMVNEQVIGKVQTFMRDGCGCALGAKSGPCSGQFMEVDVLFNLNNCFELSNDKYKLSLTVSPVELNVRGALDAASTISQCLFARKCSFTFTD